MENSDRSQEAAGGMNRLILLFLRDDKMRSALGCTAFVSERSEGVITCHRRMESLPNFLSSKDEGEEANTL